MNEQLGNLANSIGNVIESNAELQKDLLQPVCSESGALVGRVPRILNALLAEIDCWCINREAKVKETQLLTAKKLEKIKDEDIVNPPEHILIPLLQSLMCSMDCDELREMYANLLAKSMIKGESSSVHPSFVEIIRQMSPLDARNLRSFSNHRVLPALEPLIRYESKEGEECYMDYSGPFFLWDENTDLDNFSFEEHVVSVSLLIRLGLIEIRQNAELNDKSMYDVFDEAKEALLNGYTKHQHEQPNSELVFKHTIIKLTQFGRAFVKACISDLPEIEQ